jgi:hypothetical protein
MAVKYPTPTLPMQPQPVMPQPPQPVMPVQPQPVMPQPRPQPMPVMPVQPGPRPITPQPPQNPLRARLQALKMQKRQLIGQIRAIDEEIQSIKMEMRGLGGNTGGGIGGLFPQPNRPTPPPFPGG